MLDADEAIGPELWLRFRTKSRQDQIDVYRGLCAAVSARDETFRDGERSALPNGSRARWI